MINSHEFPEGALQNSSPELSVIIPAFNEEHNITEVVHESVKLLRQECGANSYEVLVVDDGSTDRTGHLCDEFSRHDPAIRVFHHAERQGLGSAWKTGFVNARGTLVCHIPGDGQIPIDQAIKLYREIGDADLIVSGRQNYRSESVHRKKSRMLHRRIMSLFARYFMMWILGFDLTGKEGIFMIRNRLLRQLRLTSSSGVLQEEILMQCYRKRDVQIKESTITILPRMSGESKVTNLSTYINTLWEIFKLRVRSQRAA